MAVASQRRLLPAVGATHRAFLVGRLRVSWFGPAWPYVCLGILLVVECWPAWSNWSSLAIGGDALIIHFPWFVLWRDQLARGDLPFWNPYTLGGLPALATPQAGFAYPPHWLATWLPAPAAVNAMVGLHVLIAGLAAAWCAGALGATREGQVLSGAAYALGSATVGRLDAGHLSFLEANAWLPLATGLAARATRARAVVLLALAVVLMALAGQPELLIFSVWWLPLWAATGSVGLGWGQVWRSLTRTGLGLALGLGLAGFFLLPLLALTGVSNRDVGMTWDFRTGASLPPWHLLEALSPTVFGDPRQGAYWPGPDYEWHERLLYVGVIPLVASTWARGRWQWACWAATAVAVGLAFGRYAPWYAWAQWLPGYQSFRIPSKHLLLAALALSLAAGLGVQRFHGRRALGSALVLAAVCAGAGLTFARWFPAASAIFGGTDALAVPRMSAMLATPAARGLEVAAAVLVLAAAAMLFAPPWDRRLLVAFAVLDLALVLQPYGFASSAPDGVASQGQPVVGYERAAVLDDTGPLLGNYGPVLAVVQPAGYTSLFSSGYAALVTGSPNPGVAVTVRETSVSILRLLGYALVYDPGRQRATVVDPAPSLVWVARCTWPGGALEVRESGFPLDDCVTRSATTARDEPIPPGDATLVAQGSGWLQAEAGGPGWLVTVQPWYPGWSARVDGESAPVELLDGALVGVWLDDGHHAVDFRYVPAGLDWGILLSLCSGLVLLGFAWWERRSSRGPRWLALLLGPNTTDPVEGHDASAVRGAGNLEEPSEEDRAALVAHPRLLHSARDLVGQARTSR